MPGIPDVNPTAGIIPSAGLPTDLATQQMQLQIQEKLAEALLAQGLAPVDPVTHGPSGNPFARDTINLGGILSKLGSGIMGREQQAALIPRQLDLARAAQQSYQSGVDQMFGTSPENRPASALEAALIGIKHPDPRVQAIAVSLLAKQGDIEQKQGITAEGTAAWAKDLQPEDLVKATRQGWLTGAPLYRPAAGQTPQLLPKGVVTSPEQAYTEINPNPPQPPRVSSITPLPTPNPAADVQISKLAAQNVPTGTDLLRGGPSVVPGKSSALEADAAWKPGMPVPPAVPGSTVEVTRDGIPVMKPPPGESVHPGPGQSKQVISPVAAETLQPGETSKDGTFTNKSSVPMTKNNAKNAWEVLHGIDATPEVIAQKNSGEYAAKKLPEGQQVQLDAKRTISRIADVMQLAKERAQFGITAEWRLKAKRLLTELNIADDEAGQIAASQTAVARMMIIAGKGAKEITGRASQQLIDAEMEAAGASREVSNDHVIDIGGTMIADILNSRDDWNNRTVPTLAGTPFGAKAHDYKVEYPDPTFEKLPMVKIEKNERGDWVNRGIQIGRSPTKPGDQAKAEKAAAAASGTNRFEGKSNEEIQRMLNQ